MFRQKLKNAALLPLESLYSYFSRRTVLKITIIALLLLGTILISGMQFMTKVKDVVTYEFNQQQLVLAQHAAGQIRQHIHMLKRELTDLSLSPAVQYYEKSFLARRLQIAFSSLKEEGAFEVRYVDATGQTTHLINDAGYTIVNSDPEDDEYFRWAREETNHSAVLSSEVYPVVHQVEYQKLIMKVAIPVWQVSVDDSHPTPANKFSGVLIVLVDVTSMMKQQTEGIKSGKTGYAWVIDSNGTFLYHHEDSLVGKNAFEARREKKPTISFARINEIQKKMMLTGQEGASWYITGWHRGKEGKIKKLIAYSPIILDDMINKKIWSVAVVAPASEVESAVHDIQIRQFIMQVIFIFIILFAAFSIIVLLAKWSTSLRHEVSLQTAEFKKSEQRYRSLVENAEDIIFTVDRQGNFLSINNFGIQFLGKGEEEIIGHTISEIFSWPTAELLLTTIREVFAINQGKQVTHLLSINDQDYWLNTNFRRLLDEEGNIYAVLGIARDITNRKEIEQQSYYTEKLASIGTLAAGVAHEINNPLAIILGFTDMLIEKAEPGSETHDILKTIEGQGLKARKVVDHLLSFVRTKEHSEVSVDINKNIEEVLSVLSNTLLVKKVSIQTLHLARALPAVTGDPDELQQVFFNIINNATYAMKGGGTLTISTQTSDDGRRIEIRFSDTGPGIKKEHRKRIFDPLFTTKKVGDGTGLGLSVSYGIITRHRGTISFETKTKEESETPGTTFIITLPAVTAPSAPPVQTA